MQVLVIAPLLWEDENSNWVRDTKLERRPQKLGLWNFRLPKWGRGENLVPRAQLIQFSVWALTNLTLLNYGLETSILSFFNSIFGFFTYCSKASDKYSYLYLLKIFIFPFFSRSWIKKKWVPMCTFFRAFLD